MELKDINIIHDSRMADRFPLLLNELRSQGIENYAIHAGYVFPHSVVESINASHKELVREAKRQNLPEICIGEDDLMFPAEGAWEHFLDKKPHPDNYDLYLGGTYIRPFDPLFVCGFHLYFVSAKFYDVFLSVPDTAHIDTAMNDLKGDFDFKLCYPMPAIQRPSYSQNNRANVNYNVILRDEDIYGFE